MTKVQQICFYDCCSVDGAVNWTLDLNQNTAAGCEHFEPQKAPAVVEISSKLICQNSWFLWSSLIQLESNVSSHPSWEMNKALSTTSIFPLWLSWMFEIVPWLSHYTLVEWKCLFYLTQYVTNLQTLENSASFYL